MLHLAQRLAVADAEATAAALDVDAANCFVALMRAEAGRARQACMAGKYS